MIKAKVIQTDGTWENNETELATDIRFDKNRDSMSFGYSVAGLKTTNSGHISVIGPTAHGMIVISKGGINVQG